MPRAPRTPDEPEPDREEGAPDVLEGPLPPGAAVVTPDEDDDQTVAELRAEAERKGVMPTEGSGSGGRVIRADIEAALASAPPDPPAGRPPLAAVAEAAAASLQPVIDRKEN